MKTNAFVLFFALAIILPTAVLHAQCVVGPTSGWQNKIYQAETLPIGNSYFIKSIGGTLYLRYTDSKGKDTILSRTSTDPPCGAWTVLLQTEQEYTFPEGKRIIKKLSAPTVTYRKTLLVRIDSINFVSGMLVRELVEFDRGKLIPLDTSQAPGAVTLNSEFAPTLMTAHSVVGVTSSYPFASVLSTDLSDGTITTLFSTDKTPFIDTFDSCCTGGKSAYPPGGPGLIPADPQTGNAAVSPTVLRRFFDSDLGYRDFNFTGQVDLLLPNGTAMKYAEGYYIRGDYNTPVALWAIDIVGTSVLIQASILVSFESELPDVLDLRTTQGRERYFLALGNNVLGDRMGISPAPQAVLWATLAENGDVWAVTPTLDKVMWL